MKMNYKIKRPNAFLSEYVECFWIWNCKDYSEEDFTNPISLHIPPSGRMDMVFNLGTKSNIVNETFTLNSDKSLVYGINKTISIYNFYNAPNFVGIKFKPAGFSHFFGIPASDIGDRPILLNEIFGAETELLTERLFLTDDEQAKFTLVEEWLVSKFKERNNNYNLIKFIINKFQNSNGAATINELCDNSESEYKKIQRAFNQNVGFSPKHLARMIRFYSIKNEIAKYDKPDWMSIVEKYNFHDQSHLIREFKSFSGLSPNEFHDSAQINTNFFKKFA